MVRHFPFWIRHIDTSCLPLWCDILIIIFIIGCLAAIVGIIIYFKEDE